MDDVARRGVWVRGPEAFTGLRQGKPKDYAAGMPAVQKALEHSFREMGVLRSIRPLVKLNQQDGFDCPSCAWPDPEKPSRVAEYCENGAKALADEATTSRIDSAFFRAHSVGALSRRSDYELNALGRLTEPMVLREGSCHYEPISWQEAYAMVADSLRGLDHPNQAIFYTSGRSSNEAAFLYGMFARALGTNNLPDCSNMCHESSGVALGETLGIGKGSVKLEDLHGADLILIAGQNPGTNHPRMLSALEKCKRNGGRIISINPLEEAGLIRFKNPQQVSGLLAKGTTLADLHLPVRINEDIPLVKAWLKQLLEKEARGGKCVDKTFIDTYTNGYEALVEDLGRYSTQDLIRQTGLNPRDVELAGEWLAGSENIIICWAMGLTQHRNGVATIREYVNLLLLKGAIGKPFAGTCPVRGHSNVQGDRSVGIQHFVDPELNQRIEKYLGFTPPGKKGVDVVEAIQAMEEGRARVFMALGGNFAMAASDTDYTARALQRCDLTVQVSTKLNRSHLITGRNALILPVLGRSEKDAAGGEQGFLTVENSMGRVRRTRGVLKPAAAGLKSEPRLICELAIVCLGKDHPVPWREFGNDYDKIRRAIDRVAKGFVDTSSRSEGPGYYLPNNARERDFSSLPGGRARFTCNELPDHRLGPGELLLMTIRSHDQFNTTIYGLDDRYRGIYNERRVLLMHPQDMEARGLKPGDTIRISSDYDGKVRWVRNFLALPYKIPKGCTAAYFPETNPLIPHDQYADHSQTPISKSVRIRVHPGVGGDHTDRPNPGRPGAGGR
ncbi:FdhF/YdeP family oxidoreductase [Robiginitalea sp. SC105]|uniref:FdhF/YdeP family oxidoreductase n=1 Tax=Robiginitalea sp. SC105 TaxID=2762332 RepID=UPI001639D41E|nr:FdhF/YdeP family oxidoreductase [Robiginitalea sp. SC105]MBC2840529.1 FdhF/YdeP family oxidoreductase [Robiginitalea sp. SC105]